MSGVLVVDDERDIHPYYAKLIRRSIGGAVFCCGLSEDAEDTIAKIRPVIDLVISDINRPGKNGLDFARDMHARYPALRIILISGSLTGLGQEQAEVMLKTGIICGMLSKPFAIDDLQRMLRDTVH